MKIRVEPLSVVLFGMLPVSSAWAWAAHVCCQPHYTPVCQSTVEPHGIRFRIARRT